MYCAQEVPFLFKPAKQGNARTMSHMCLTWRKDEIHGLGAKQDKQVMVAVAEHDAICAQKLMNFGVDQNYIGQHTTIDALFGKMLLTWLSEGRTVIEIFV